MWSDLAALDDHRLGATNSPFKLPITLTITSVVAPSTLAGQNNGSFLELDFADPIPLDLLYEYGPDDNGRVARHRQPGGYSARRHKVTSEHSFMSIRHIQHTRARVITGSPASRRVDLSVNS